MSKTRKFISIVLSLCMLISVMTVGIVPVSAATNYETYAQDTIQGSAILHCFDWTYNNIKSALPDIAKAGYTAVQTSPVQRPKDYNSTWTDAANQWWKMYQPLGLSIAADGTSWLGTKAELTSLCTEAEKYDIKVVVDIVANHLANNGTDGGTYDYVNSSIESDLKNSNYFHTNNTRTNDNSRYNITQYHLGMPDLNTGNYYVQQRALGLLEECIDCGVDGFRFDAAKHIETPTDDSSCRSNFWSTVINGATSYAQNKGVDTPFYYGEILGNAGPNFGVSNYTTYMAVTDNYTGDRALDKTYYQWAPELADSTYYKGATADKSVLWVESHDTYMGESGSSGSSELKNTSNVSADVIQRAWAIVGARADSTALYFARPNSTMGAQSSDNTWKSTTVAEVNKFKNHFDGTSEYIANSGNTIAYVQRGTKGIVISKLDGSGDVSISSTTMENGTYKDQVTGNTFTVSNGTISGTVGSVGVAVVYNAEDPVYEYIENDTLYLKPNSNWTQASARFAMYVYNASTGANAWADLTDSDNDGYYSADVPSGDWTNVIFVRMNPSSDENRWDAYDGEGHVWNKTNDLFPDDDTNCYTVADGAWTQGDGSWSLYSVSQTTTAAPTTVEPTTDAPATAEPTTPSDTITIYAINNANWSKVNVHYWGDGETDWPGAAMTSISGKKVYSFEVPRNVSGIVFTNGASSSTKQTGNITSGIADGATWIIGSASSNNYPVSVAPDYYLVGTMNNWSNNNDYKFTISATDSGKLEYKLSGVELAANAEFKVHSSSGSWYPSGSNHTVSEAGIYDIYFRPNGDGDSAWLVDSSETSKKYVYPANVTPYTITWKDGDGETLKTETVTYGNTPQYSGETPTKTATDQYTYTFNDTWSPAVEPATADATYTAQFTPTTRSYTVTWKNYDGTTLDTDTVEYGATPSYDGETPTRPNQGATTYTFSGWSPEITDQTTVTGDVTYTARFSENLQTYTITWKDGDGETLKTETCIQGVTPQYTGDTPTKTATDQYSYTFNNTWDPPIAAADRDTTYTAQFDSTVNKYTITWKDGNGNTLKTEELEYGTTPSYNGTTPTKDEDADYIYTFNDTWSPEITFVTKNATYTAQFDATDRPRITVCATNVVGWEHVYIYYWTDFGDNSWPGEEMTSDGDNFICSAEIPDNAKGIIFTDGASSDAKQTVNIESGITDGAHWAILNEKDTNETSKYKVHSVPTYYLVGTMTQWSTNSAPTFTPIKNENKLEEYKLSNVALSKDVEIKVYGSNDVWFPGGDNYKVPATGIYDIYFRPNGDGNNDWHESVFYVENVTEYTITWIDGNGQTLKTDTVKHGDTPEYTGDTPTKTTDDQYEYTFNTTWSPQIVEATADAEYTAQFDKTAHELKDTWTWNKTGETYSVSLRLECENDGCGFIIIIPVPANSISSAVTTQPTCTATGVRTYTATYEYNGHTYTGTQTDIISANGHNMSHHAAVAATCAQPGNSEYWECSVCDKYFLDEQGNTEIQENSWVIHATGEHHFDTAQTSWRWEPFGNTYNAYVSIHCADCSYSEEAAATVETVSTQDAACTEDGSINYSASYTACGQTFTDTYTHTIPATGHRYDYSNIIWDWDGVETARATFVCLNNTAHIVYENATISSSVTTPATCTETGIRTYTASVQGPDGNNYSDTKEETIPANGHNWDVEHGTWYWDGFDNFDINDPDNTYGNIHSEMEVYCPDCQAVTQLQATVQFTTNRPASCYATGEMVFTATLTDYPEYSDTYRIELPITHGTMEHVNYLAPTCQDDGHNEYWRCTVCGLYFADEDATEALDWDTDIVIPASGHNMTAHPAHDATCTEAGNSEYWSCDRCNKYFSDENGQYEITENSWVIPANGHTLTAYPAVAATCTHGGNIEYWKCTTCGKFFADVNGENEITELQTLTPATGHNYGQPVWSWADDYSSATATFTCSANDDTQILNAVVTPTYESDKTVYTAKVTFNNVEYTDTQEGDFKLFIGHSLTLEGDIGVNFFLNSATVGGKNAQVKFSWYDKDPDPVDVVYDETYGMYKATCYVAVAEMTCPITATVYIDGEAQEQQNVYTVKEYADKMLTNEKFINSYKASETAAGRDGNARYAKLKKLIETMLDYGTRAQVRFDVNQEAYANGGTYYDTSEVSITSNPSDMYSNLDKYGLTYVGSSIIYLSKTTLRHYYRVSNTEAFADYEGVIVPSGSRDGMIYFDITNISAPNFGTKYELTLGTEKYYYSVLDYIGKILVNESFSEESKELGKAADRYYRAAVDYFG